MSEPGGLLAPGEPVDLSNCDREPIHIPGAIQPHGLLLTVEADGRIVQVSGSLATLLGQSAPQLVGGRVAAVLGDEAAVIVGELLDDGSVDPGEPRAIIVADRPWELVAHRSDGLLVCELEPREAESTEIEDERGLLDELDGISEISRHAAVEIRRIAGYDRVMVYRFDVDGHGEVIAEDADQRLDSFLGHHYPASDIPRQARALYLRQTIRMIVDVDYEPSVITPPDNPRTGEPLDLSLSRLRSVSPVHLEYLRNMGVTATLVISIIQDGDLWGLVACHHYSPRYADGGVRAACLRVGEQLATVIADQERRELNRQRADLEVLARQLLQLVRNAPSPPDGLLAGEKLLLRICDADGAAIMRGGVRQTFGVVPSTEDERLIIERMPAGGMPLVMDRLTRELPFVSHNTDMCGVFACPLGDGAGDYVIWYRDEWVHDLTWGGDPGATLRPDLTSTSLKSLSPRRSFEAWRQAVVGRSQPWGSAQVAVGTQLSRELADHL